MKMNAFLNMHLMTILCKFLVKFVDSSSNLTQVIEILQNSPNFGFVKAFAAFKFIYFTYVALIILSD